MDGSSDNVFSGLAGGLLLGVSYSDFAVPIGLLFFTIVLHIGLGDVDYSDFIAGLTYVLATAGCGMVFVVVLPTVGGYAHKGFRHGILWLIMLSLLSTIRWFRLYTKQKSLQNVIGDAKDGD